MFETPKTTTMIIIWFLVFQAILIVVIFPLIRFVAATCVNLPPLTVMPPERVFGVSSDKNVISFSLFNVTRNPHHVDLAIGNINKAKELYPGWTCIFFIDETVPVDGITKLKIAGAEIQQITDDHLRKMDPNLWKYLIHDLDPHVEAFIARKVETLNTKREANAVKQWIDSDKAIHIMRDHPRHVSPIIDGMMGVKKGALPSLYKRMVEYARNGVTDDINEFLVKVIWPIAKVDSFQNDAFYCDKYNTFNFRDEREGRSFIGAKYIGDGKYEVLEKDQEESTVSPAQCHSGSRA